MSNRQKDGSLYVRCPGTSWEDILDQDAKTHKVADFLYEESLRDLGSEPISTEAYTSAEYFELERTKMWPFVWQFAAREEELPDAGDVVVYENVGKSFILSRQDDGSIKAFHNVCLHRGRKLCDESGNKKSFVCPFHGFTWNKNGQFKGTPCKWDFAHLDDKDMSLPEVQVHRYGGYVFINEDPNAEPFESWAAPLTEHFDHWNHAESYTAVWVGKVIRCNWKTASEAFMEAWHSLTTHPQIVPYTGDANTRYDIYGDHLNRALTPFAVLSPHLENKGLDEQHVVDEYIRTNQTESFELNVEDQTARKALAQIKREQYGEMYGRDLSHLSDGEFMDAFVYNVFPNFAPWGGYIPNIVYRFRPWPDQDQCLMEVRVLMRAKPGEAHPRAPEMRFLDADQAFMDAADLLTPVFAQVFDQDMANLPHIHTGLQSSVNKKIELGNYQEIRIRHFYQTMQKYFDKN